MPKTDELTKNKFNKMKFITEYRKMAKIYESNPLFYRKIIDFLRRFIGENDHDPITRALSGLNRIEKKTALYYFTAGITYLFQTEWDELVGGDYIKTGRIAIKYFEKLIKLEPENIEAYCRLFYTHMVLGHYKMAIAIFKTAHALYRKMAAERGSRFVLTYFPVLRGLAYGFDAWQHYWLAIGHYKVKNEKEALEHLNRSLESNRYHIRANWFMGYFIQMTDSWERALPYFKFCRKLEPNWAEPYFRISLILWNKRKFKAASLYALRALTLARKFYKKEFKKDYYKFKAFYYFMSGMWQWRDGEINKVYECFRKMACLIKTFKIKEFQSFVVLVEILKADKKILNLFHQETLIDLKRKTKILHDKLFNLADKYKDLFTKKSAFTPFISVKIAFVAALLSTLDKKIGSLFAEFLRKKLSESESVTNFSDTDLIIKFLESHKTYWVAEGFQKISQSINLLENFILEIKKDLTNYSSIQKIPQEKQKQLIRSLGPFSEAMDGAISKFYAENILTKREFIRKMRYFKETFKSYMEGLKKNLKIEMADMMRVELEEFRQKLPPQAEILGKSGTEEKQIKILTNVDDTGNTLKEIKSINISESELEERKKDIQKYLIWLNYKTGEAYIFGKPFTRKRRDLGGIEKGVKLKKIRKLVGFLLENNGALLDRSEIYKAYTNQNFFSDTPKSKNLIRKIISNLNIYSGGSLKDYIIRGAEGEIGIDVKGKPFCIIY